MAGGFNLRTMHESREERTASGSRPGWETFRYFLRLGCLGFGGPLALIAQMQRDLVENRRWIEPEAFARAFSIIKAMPGPVAFQCAVFLGRKRAGLVGAFAAALGLNGPPFLLMILFSIFYESWRHVRGGSLFLTGMQAGALAVILASLGGLSGTHKKKPVFWTIAGAAGALTYFFPSYEPLYIVGFGVLTVIYSVGLRSPNFSKFLPKMNLAILMTSGGLQEFLYGKDVLLVTESLRELALICFKAGALVFGSGLAIVPLLENDFVQRLGWLTHQEFLDALAFGQITPGPVVITATFIGFKRAGLYGALVATVAIFLAPFAHMTTWFPSFVDRLAKQKWISAFLTGAIGAVVGSIFATTLRLSTSLDVKMISLPLIASAYFILYRRKKTPAWLIIPACGFIALVLGVLLRGS